MVSCKMEIALLLAEGGGHGIAFLIQNIGEGEGTLGRVNLNPGSRLSNPLRVVSYILGYL